MSETSLLLSFSSSSSFSPSFVLPSEILGDDDDGGDVSVVVGVNSFFPSASCSSRFSCSRAKGLLLLFLLVVVTAVSFTSAFGDDDDDDAISSHSLLLRVACIIKNTV